MAGGVKFCLRRRGTQTLLSVGPACNAHSPPRSIVRRCNNKAQWTSVYLFFSLTRHSDLMCRLPSAPVKHSHNQSPLTVNNAGVSGSALPIANGPTHSCCTPAA